MGGDFWGRLWILASVHCVSCDEACPGCLMQTNALWLPRGVSSHQQSHIHCTCTEHFMVLNIHSDALILVMSAVSLFVICHDPSVPNAGWLQCHSSREVLKSDGKATAAGLPSPQRCSVKWDECKSSPPPSWSTPPLPPPLTQLGHLTQPIPLA